MRTSLRCLAASAKDKGLPPLPPISTWKPLFPRAQYSKAPDARVRNFPGRILLASRKLCDDFVKAIKLQPDELVIEVNPGHGQLTRSLLAGGNAVKAERWTVNQLEIAKEANKKMITATKKEAAKEKLSAKESWMTASHPSSTGRLSKFPLWEYDLLAGKFEMNKLNRTKELPIPVAVVAVEPSPDIICKGLGLSPEFLPHPEVIDLSRWVAEGEPEPVVNVYPSVFDSRLHLSPSSCYRWSTLTGILSDPNIAKIIEKHQPSQSEGAESKPIEGTIKRSWQAPAPKITLVAHMPDSIVGEQMIAQWIASVVGSKDDKRSWIWEYGRIRMALLMGSDAYDRIMTLPREAAHNKLSVIAHALFDLEPLPPYHHVTNIDKALQRTESRPIPENPPLPTWSEFRTSTYPKDFHPSPYQVALKTAFSRPPILGIMFTPKKDPIIKIESKEEWDYVLRKCFFQEAQPIKEAIKNLGFGASNLVDKLEEEKSVYKGIGFPRDTIVRNLEIGMWERVVDVFDKWAFKPENLVLDSRATDELTSREIGQD